MFISCVGMCCTSSIALASMRKRTGKAGEPWGRLQRKGLVSSICCTKEKNSHLLVVKAHVHS
jgi:hypothetical protein